MYKLVVYKDSIQGRLARVLWSYGRFSNVTLELSDTNTATVLMDGNTSLMEQWPSIISHAIKGSPTEDVLVPADAVAKSTMNSWLDFALQRDFRIMQKSCVQMLDKYLLNHTFLVGNNITVADLVVYVSTHSWMLKSESVDRLEFVNLVRWFDHIQHLPGIVNSFKDLPLVPIEKDMELVTTVMEKVTVTPPGSKGKPSKVAAKSALKDNKNPKQPAEDRPIADVSRLNIRVGQIKSVERHPEADRLYCLKIDLGESELRDICSGLVDYLSPEQLLSQYVCVLSNMKPKSLRGKMSNGMVLCVSNEDHTKIELLKPAMGSVIGERVVMEGCAGEPDTVLSTKTGKDPFVAVQPEFKCRDKRAYYKEHPFMTSKGPCTCETLLTGTIS